MEHHSAVLLRRLNRYCARALEGAASLCQTRAHAEIMPDHGLLKLPEQGEGELTVLVRRYEWGTGARNVDSLLNQQSLPVLRQRLLSHMAAKQKPSSLQQTWDDKKGIVLAFDEQAQGEVL